MHPLFDWKLRHLIEIFCLENGQLSAKSHMARVDNQMLHFINGGDVPIRLVTTDDNLMNPSGDRALNATFKSIDKETFGKTYHARVKGRSLHLLKWNFKQHPLQFLDDGILLLIIAFILLFFSGLRVI